MLQRIAALTRIRREQNWQPTPSGAGRRWATALCGLFILLAATSGGTQDIKIGNRVTPEQLAEMQKQASSLTQQIAQAQSREFKLDVGTFLTVDPPESVKTPMLWLVTDETITKTLTVPAGTPFMIFMRKAGDKEAKLHEFPAKPYAWYLLVGIKQGRTIISIIVNGEAGKAPVLLDKLDLQVGPDKPPPPPPDADPLVKLALADIAAGKGTMDDLGWYRGYLTATVNALPALSSYPTSKEFWVAFRERMTFGLELTEVQKANILPTMRAAIGKLLNEMVPEKEGDAFDSTRRTQIATALKAIAARLEVK